MKVRDVMTRNVETVSLDATLQEVARKMRDLDVGALPVRDGEGPIGIVTDRDITIRAIAEGRDPGGTRVQEIMTDDVTCAYEDEEIEAVALRMQEKKIRRIPILDRRENLVGIVALGDLAVDTGDDSLSGETLEEISTPSRPER